MEEKNRKTEARMRLVKAIHSKADMEHIDKYRQSQKNLGTLWKISKEVKYNEFMIDGIEAEWVRAARKHNTKNIIMYCHGGGFFSGNLEYARMITSKLSMTASLDVLSFNYRLAPEHPYPNGLDDVTKVWDYLMHLGYGASEIVLAGDSAGGNLALALVHRLRQQGRKVPRGIVCLSPWTDLLCTGKSHQTRRELDPILDQDYLEAAIKAYADGENLSDCLISPLYGDFHNFPPVYIQAGENEILLSDAKRLYKYILKAGSYGKMDIYSGMWHDFQMIPFKTSYEAIDDITDFIYELCW